MSDKQLLEKVKKMQQDCKRTQKMIEDGKLPELTALQAYKDIDFYISYMLQDNK